MACFTDENEKAVKEVKALHTWLRAPGVMPNKSSSFGQTQKKIVKLELSPRFRMDLKKEVNQPHSFFITLVSQQEYF